MMAGRVTPMRVTHVLYGGLGGHATVVFDATEGTKDDVSLVFLSPAPPLPQHKELARARGMTWTWVPANARDLRYPMRLRNALRGQDPNVIIVHSAGALLPALSLSRLPRGPALVYVEHHSMPLRERKMDVASRLALRSADAVIVLSDDYAAALKTRFPNLPHDRVHVIPNGVDTQVFAPGQKVRREPSPLRLGMQSRLTDIKDHPTLLRAVRLLVTDGCDVVLRIAGGGPELERLKSLAADLDVVDHVEFTGLLDQSELVGFLRGTDIYVHATLGEASSTAILQAMAVGLPVVASRVPGVVGMIPARAGFLVPPRDAGALASAIGRYVADAEMRRAAGVVSRSHVETHYTLETMRGGYSEIIRARAGGEPVAPSDGDRDGDRAHGNASPDSEARRECGAC